MRRLPWTQWRGQASGQDPQSGVGEDAEDVRRGIDRLHRQWRPQQEGYPRIRKEGCHARAGKGSGGPYPRVGQEVEDCCPCWQRCAATSLGLAAGMTWERAVKQSKANRLLDLQRGPAPFPGLRVALRMAALTGTAHPSFVPAELGWFHFWPGSGSAIPFFSSASRRIPSSLLASPPPATVSDFPGEIHEQGPFVRRHPVHWLQAMRTGVRGKEPAAL